jgi:hypothetical protein
MCLASLCFPSVCPPITKEPPYPWAFFSEPHERFANRANYVNSLKIEGGCAPPARLGSCRSRLPAAWSA